MSNWRSKYLIYTDGSFCKELPGEVHGGIAYCDAVTGRMYSCAHIISRDRMFTRSWSVGGECMAAYVALFAQIVELKEAGFTDKSEPIEIELVYDYEGIGSWITRAWPNANTPVAKWYRRMIDSLLAPFPNIKMKWTWVKGHANTDGNIIADTIASYTMDCLDNYGAKVFCFDDENDEFRFK